MSWRKEQGRTERGYHHGNLKEALLQAALDLIAKKGAAGFTFADATNAMGAFTVVRAASHEAAAKMFEDHPHFSIFPGESVEIMPVLPIPGG